MKQSSITVLLLLVVFVCFISMSALSGEDPWDADDHFSLSSGNSNSSSSSSSTDNMVYVNYLDSPLDILFNISFEFVMWSYDVNNSQLRTGKFSRELKKGIRYK
jgi:hypothetical protein